MSKTKWDLKAYKIKIEIKITMGKFKIEINKSIVYLYLLLAYPPLYMIATCVYLEFFHDQKPYRNFSYYSEL